MIDRLIKQKEDWLKHLEYNKKTCGIKGQVKTYQFYSLRIEECELELAALIAYKERGGVKNGHKDFN